MIQIRFVFIKQLQQQDEHFGSQPRALACLFDQIVREEQEVIEKQQLNREEYYFIKGLALFVVYAKLFEEYGHLLRFYGVTLLVCHNRLDLGLYNGLIY